MTGKSSISCHVCFLITLLSNLVTFEFTRSFLVAPLHRDNFPPAASFGASASSSRRHRQSRSVENVYQLAYNHSMGFFDTISDQSWIRYYQKPVVRHLASLAQKEEDSNSVENVSQWIYHHMIPTFVCPHSQKVGNPAGKWMCDPERWVRYFARKKQQQASQKQQQEQQRQGLPCLVYSIGSKGNFRWEEEFVQILGRDDLCEFHIFDPSPVYESAELLRLHPHWHYHAWGLRGVHSTKNYTRRRDRFLDFGTIRERLGHQHRPIDILKMDCEGAEWESMPDWLGGGTPANASFPDLHHVLLETHSLPLPDAVRSAGNFGKFLPMPAVVQLEREFARHGFVLYAKEVNTHKGLGRSVEFGFVRLQQDFFVDDNINNSSATVPR